jgi:hypothetical protein
LGGGMVAGYLAKESASFQEVSRGKRHGIAGPDSGEEVGVEKLVLATGAQVRKLDLAGTSSKNLLYLRSLSDSQRIRDKATRGEKAVVIGAASSPWKCRPCSRAAASNDHADSRRPHVEGFRYP